ncbi:hypothetical protein BT96DRAFT_1025066 [Gymnopus androsaceus JB14]|uniref:Uncharacterized protein n=1 Tax=Gymnopus androsaceus JB14 TaxID=1447944 RepID=A0A6A4GVN5_9AGAR|nr:hypothetical protein BT96DRAFT_1025066 [Gymnopus androsaceus JB14]
MRAQLVFGIGSGVYCLRVLFDNPGDLLMRLHWRKCISLDTVFRSFCDKTLMMNYLTLALFVQIWLIQILGLYSSQAYVQELMDEDGDAVKVYDYNKFW